MTLECNCWFSTTPREMPLDARNWLTDDRLREIGFVFDVMPGAPEAEDAYRRALPRLAWVAFEYNGPAWREIERQRALAAEHADHRHGGAPEPSRLVPVDAAADAETLTGRYPTDHLIMRASIELVYVPPSRNGPIVYGRIRHLIPPTVSVPRALRPPLTGLGPTFGAPRFQVEIAVGRWGIPYVAAVRKLAASTSQ